MSFSGLFQNSFLVQRLLISNARFCIDLPRFAGEAKLNFHTTLILHHTSA